MLPDDQLKAIRDHAAVIEEYDRAYQREAVRLLESHKETFDAIVAKLPGWLDQREDLRGQIRILWLGSAYRTNDEANDEANRQQALDRQQALEHMMMTLDTGLHDFEARQKPNVVPYDTPRKIVDAVRHELNVQDLIHKYVHGLDKSDSAAAKRLRGPYRKMNARAYAFCPMAPSVIDILTEARDPFIGLQRIEALFSIVVGTRVVADGETAEVRPNRLTLEDFVQILIGGRSKPTIAARLVKATSERGSISYQEAIEVAWDGNHASVATVNTRCHDISKKAEMAGIPWRWELDNGFVVMHAGHGK